MFRWNKTLILHTVSSGNERFDNHIEIRNELHHKLNCDRSGYSLWTLILGLLCRKPTASPICPLVVNLQWQGSEDICCADKITGHAKWLAKLQRQILSAYPCCKIYRNCSKNYMIASFSNAAMLYMLPLICSSIHFHLCWCLNTGSTGPTVHNFPSRRGTWAVYNTRFCSRIVLTAGAGAWSGVGLVRTVVDSESIVSTDFAKPFLSFLFALVCCSRRTAWFHFVILHHVCSHWL